MAESSIQVTQGSGTRLRTTSRTISAQTVHSEYAMVDDSDFATYQVLTAALSLGSATHLLQIMAGSSLNVYLRRLRVWQRSDATTGAITFVDLQRLTSAGTGGTALTPAPRDTADSASGATAMAIPSAPGSTGTIIDRASFYVLETIPTTVLGGYQGTLLLDWDFDAGSRSKVPRIAAGTSNGLALILGTAVAGATVNITATITEQSY